MTSAGPLPANSRHRGRIHEWRTDKGYGYVQHDDRRLFVHIRDFAERHVTPEAGDLLTFEVGVDARGRPCAKSIRQHNDGGRLRSRHFLVLALLLAVPASAFWRLAPAPMAGAVAVVALLCSAACYGFYAWDKHRARTGAWRISERMLHLMELFGGWPGAFLAQRRLRHKSTKASYQFTFWMIVAAHNYAALDWQLQWRITRSAAEKISGWLDVDSRSPSNPSRVY